jgi:uncharacterized protein YqhQ
MFVWCGSSSIIIIVIITIIITAVVNAPRYTRAVPWQEEHGPVAGA